MVPDLILKNGEIFTMNEQKDVYDSISIKDGRVLELGETKTLERKANEQTTIIDLNGKTVLPGFIDAHQHMVSFGFNLLHVNCQLDSIEKVIQAIEERARQVKPDEWIIGFGFDEAQFIEGRTLTKEDFSHIQNPVYITRFCLHTAVVNERALELAQITVREHQNLSEEIDMDESGMTGILRESALDLVRRVIPPYTEAQIKEAVTLASKQYVKEGITSVHEAGMGFITDSLKEFFVLRDMSNNGELDVRVYGMILEKFWKEMKEKNLLKKEVENDFFSLGSIKLFADGTLSSQTAAMLDGYAPPIEGKGLFVYEKKELEEKVLRAHEAGKQIAIHAIGDAAVDLVVTAYEKAIKATPRKDHRHRIEHCGISNDYLLERIKELNIVVVPHPGIVYFAGDVYKRVLKEDALQGLYTMKKFMEYDLQPALSSDCPVLPSSPLYSIYAVMTRETSSGDVLGEDQCISLYEAVTMYTKNAATAAFNEENQGSLCVGKFADMVILPEKFMHFTPHQVKQTEVEMTIVNGLIKYDKLAKKR